MITAIRHVSPPQVAMYGCERWNKKKAEHWKIDVFQLQCWRRLLRIHWTARRSNQSILKEINPEYSLEGMALKRQSFDLLMRRANSSERPWCWEGLRAGEEGGDRGWDGWMASSTQWTWVWANSGRWWRTGKPSMLQSMGSPRVRHDWGTEPMSPVSPALQVDFSVLSHLGSPNGVVFCLFVWKSLSCVVTPWNIQSIELSRPEYWSG